MSLNTQLLCGFRLFLLGKPSCNWQCTQFAVVDAFYTSLQIRCVAHNLLIAEFTEYKKKYNKGPTFSFAVYCCTQRIGWRSQRQSEKVNIRDACFLPVRAKCGRFCVLMNGRVFGHSKLLVLRTAATVHPPYWQNGGSYPPDLTVTDRLLVPANAKAGSAARSSNKIIDPSPRGLQDTRSIFAATEFSGLCPPLSTLTGSYLPMRHRTNPDNFTG